MQATKRLRIGPEVCDTCCDSGGVRVGRGGFEGKKKNCRLKPHAHDTKNGWDFIVLDKRSRRRMGRPLYTES